MKLKKSHNIYPNQPPATDSFLTILFHNIRRETPLTKARTSM